MLTEKWAKGLDDSMRLAMENFDLKTLGIAGTMKALTAQPLEEIREYFGEQIALYFAFIEVYTQSLVWPAIIGVVTMVGHV